jgi:hypothetical protein
MSGAPAKPATELPDSPPRILYRDRRDIPRNQVAAIVWGARMARASVNRRARTMDYRKANAADGGHVVTRRRFAAGFWAGGGRINHISRAELRRVKREILPGVRVQPWVRQARVKGPSCTGLSKFQGPIDNELTWTRTWLNSCETNNIVHFTIMAASFVGILCIFIPFAWVAGVSAGMAAIGAEYLALQQDRSPVNATMVQSKYYIVSAYPQL